MINLNSQFMKTLYKYNNNKKQLFAKFNTYNNESTKKHRNYALSRCYVVSCCCILRGHADGWRKILTCVKLLHFTSFFSITFSHVYIMTHIQIARAYTKPFSKMRTKMLYVECSSLF